VAAHAGADIRAVELDQSAWRPRKVFSVKVSIPSVDIERRLFVTNTWCACGNDALVGLGDRSLSVATSTVAVWVRLTARHRDRPLSMRESLVRASARRAHPLMCGRGRCGRMRRSAG
jgi:hypothetical protein